MYDLDVLYVDESIIRRHTAYNAVQMLYVFISNI